MKAAVFSGSGKLSVKETSYTTSGHNRFYVTTFLDCVFIITRIFFVVSFRKSVPEKLDEENPQVRFLRIVYN